MSHVKNIYVGLHSSFNWFIFEETFSLYFFTAVYIRKYVWRIFEAFDVGEISFIFNDHFSEPLNDKRQYFYFKWNEYSILIFKQSLKQQKSVRISYQDMWLGKLINSDELINVNDKNRVITSVIRKNNHAYGLWKGLRYPVTHRKVIEWI